MNPTVIVSIIAGCTTLFAALISRNSTLKAKQMDKDIKDLEAENERLKADKKELMTSFNALEIVTDLKFFNIIKDKVEYIFNNTTADRFLILFAVNGTTEFNFVNVIYEEHKDHPMIALSSGAVSRYMNVRIDKPYKTFLKQIEWEGSMLLEVAEMRDCLLKDYYEAEKVKHSLMSFISRLKKDEQNDIIIYCTVASHGDTCYTSREQNIINLGVSGIQAASNNLFLKQK